MSAVTAEVRGHAEEGENGVEEERIWERVSTGLGERCGGGGEKERGVCDTHISEMGSLVAVSPSSPIRKGILESTLAQWVVQKLKEL